jgi:hypothetical protein
MALIHPTAEEGEASEAGKEEGEVLEAGMEEGVSTALIHPTAEEGEEEEEAGMIGVSARILPALPAPREAPLTMGQAWNMRQASVQEKGGATGASTEAGTSTEAGQEEAGGPGRVVGAVEAGMRMMTDHDD